MNLIGNILWFVLGGVFMGLGWCLAGLLACLSIIGLPWGRACFVIAQFTFFPFGKTVIRRDVLHGKNDIGTGALGTLGNIVWFVFFGWWLAVGHISCAIANAVTIIGIPFAWQHLKLARLALWPVGMTVVPGELADAALSAQAAERLRNLRDGY